MTTMFAIKNRGRLGPGKTDDKIIRILNRCVEWKADGIHYEADPRHSEIIIDEMKISGGKGVVTPGIKIDDTTPDMELPLDAQKAPKFKQITARANYLSHDRLDIQYAVKELSRGMAKPTE